MRYQHALSGFNTTRRLKAIAFSSLLYGILLFPAQPSHATTASICIPIQANIEARFVTENCMSPVGLCTAGKITKGGLLNGTTEFTALGIAVAAGMPGIEPDTTLSYHGVLTITTKHGTLEISDVGVFDQVTGVFSELDRVVSGTGRFEDASGTLFIYGDAFADDSGFTGSIAGQVCLD